jgi:hypothetical protein
VPTPTPTPAPNNGTPDAPLPLVGTSFSYDDFGASWDVLLLGLVETPLHEWNDAAGSCLVLIGTMRPTSIRDGAVTSGFSTPGLGTLTNGQYIEDGVNDCNTDQVDATGYAWILNAEVTLNTTYHFHTEFFIPEGQEVQAVVLGNPRDNNAGYLTPDVITTIPTPELQSEFETPDTVPLAGAGFTYEDFSATTSPVVASCSSER